MIYLLLTTTAGSLLLSGFLVWQKLFDSRLAENVKYRALILVLWVYMVPWVWLKRPYEILFDILLRAEAAGTIHKILKELYEALAKMYEMAGDKWFLLAGIVWGSGVVVLMTVKVAAYFFERNLLFSVAKEWGIEISTDTETSLREELVCRRWLRIYRIPGERISLATGLIRPVIFLQETATEREQNFVLRHEMIHIARKDSALRLFMELVCCLHWFNPLIYVMKSCFLALRETSCDERVIRGCTKDERAIYARLITDSIREQRRKFMFYSRFGNDYKRTRRRVELIMQEKVSSKPGKWAAIGCFALLIAVDSMAALFYPSLL